MPLDIVQKVLCCHCAECNYNKHFIIDTTTSRTPCRQIHETNTFVKYN